MRPGPVARITGPSFTMASSKKSPDGPDKGDVATQVLQGILEEMEDDSAQLLGSDANMLKIRGVISTQNVAIDKSIGRGGVPLGRLTILHGGEGSGKTTLALQIVAEVQRMGGVAVYCDKEYKLDPEYAAKLGVDTKRLIISQPSYLERAFQTWKAVISKAAEIRQKQGKRIPILIVLDSMNACITKMEYEGDEEDQHYAPAARIFSTQLPKLIPEVNKEDVALLFISQVRKKIGVMFGDDEDVAGGNAPKFYASLIMHIKRVGTERDEKTKQKEANKLVVECKKNQIAPPFRKAEVIINYGSGFDGDRSLIDVACDLKIMEKAGAYYKYKGESLGQGMKATKKALRKNPSLRAEIEKKVRKSEGW